MSHRTFRGIVLLGFSLSIAGVLWAQRTRARILVVNGNNAGAAVVQFGGRSYIDIDTLAQITNGSVTYQPDRILLTIPGSSAGATSCRPRAVGSTRSLPSRPWSAAMRWPGTPKAAS